MSHITHVTERQKAILLTLKREREYNIAEISSFDTAASTSLATLKRDLSVLVKSGYLELIGERKGSKYKLSNYGLIHRPYSARSYVEKESLKTESIISFNEALFSLLRDDSLFTTEELNKLEESTKVYYSRADGVSDNIHKRELERFVIELSWKSSKIEGNTYTLLDTEKLLKENIVAEGKTKDETTMILSHKEAFNYILECVKRGKELQSFRELENIHRLLVNDLGINHGLRKRGVGITGSRYLPLDIATRIEEETKNLISLIQAKNDFYSKALLSVLCVSYIQPFEDGNKRTGRLFANAMLMEGGLAPLSYRDVDEKIYREAVLIFYEQNSIEAFKQIFIEQYIFSSHTYNLA
jgi:Fic family protein